MALPNSSRVQRHKQNPNGHKSLGYPKNISQNREKVTKIDLRMTLDVIFRTGPYYPTSKLGYDPGPQALGLLTIW